MARLLLDKEIMGHEQKHCQFALSGTEIGQNEGNVFAHVILIKGDTEIITAAFAIFKGGTHCLGFSRPNSGCLEPWGALCRAFWRLQDAIPLGRATEGRLLPWWIWKAEP